VERHDCEGMRFFEEVQVDGWFVEFLNRCHVDGVWLRGRGGLQRQVKLFIRGAGKEELGYQSGEQ
jgi:hypothetical protein